MHQYKMPVYQFCIYLGSEPSKMADDIKQVVPKAQNPFNFTLIEVRKLPYDQLLNSNTPEAVVLAILANPMSQTAEEVLDLTLKRLQECCNTNDELEKYAGQILKLSKLRNLQLLAKEKIDAMPIHYDVTTDILFVEGEAKGRAEGNENGVVAMLKSGKLTTVEIADLMGMPINQVEEIKTRHYL